MYYNIFINQKTFKYIMEIFQMFIRLILFLYSMSWFSNFRLYSIIKISYDYLVSIKDRDIFQYCDCLLWKLFSITADNFFSLQKCRRRVGVVSFLHSVEQKYDYYCLFIFLMKNYFLWILFFDLAFSQKMRMGNGMGL